MKFGLESCVKNKVRLITFCNTRKQNALSADSYNEIANILNGDAKNDDIIATILTGEGEYFTSGNDFSAMKLAGDFDYEEQSKILVAKFVRMVDAILKYPKLLVSVVNGPAVGIGFTILGLSDLVYASGTATFSAPFVKLGLCIEGCGSYLLPRIMGKSKASEVLLLGHKMNAQEALSFNLISKIVPREDVPRCISNLITELSNLPLDPVVYNRKLITDNIMDDLLKCAEREASVLSKCPTSELFLTNLMNFMNKKNRPVSSKL